MLNDFLQLFLIKFDDLVKFILHCVSWWFFGRNRNNLKNFLCKLLNCGFQPFLRCKSYLESRTLCPILNLGFSNSRSGLLYGMDRKSEFLTFFNVKAVENFFLKFMVVTTYDRL